MAICCVSLIPALLDKRLQILDKGERTILFQKHEEQTCDISNRASRCGVQPSTPHSSGFRGPCIWPFLNNLEKMTFSTACQCTIGATLKGSLIKKVSFTSSNDSEKRVTS